MNLNDTYLVAPPGLQMEDRGEQVMVSNPVLGTQVMLNRHARDMLALFCMPCLGRDYLESGGSVGDLVVAVEAAILMDTRLLLRPAGPAAMVKAVALDHFLTDSMKPADFAVVGVGSDVGAGADPGARNGPMLIRDEFARLEWLAQEAQENDPEHSSTDVLLDLDMRRTYSSGLPSIVDLGDVALLPGEGLTTIGARLELFATLLVNRGSRVVLLGGDHSLTHWSLRPHLKRHPRLGIIHFDAHHDLVPPLMSGMNYVTHSNPFAEALRSGCLEHLHQIGLRMVEAARSNAIVHDARITYVSAREAQTADPERVFAGLPRNIPYYLSFDIDCITPDIAPETGTPVAGGLSFYQAIDLVDYAARSFKLVGFDLVEVGGARRGSSRAARIAARLALQMFLGPAPFEPLTSYLRRA